MTYNGRAEHKSIADGIAVKFTVENPPAVILEETKWIDLNHCNENHKVIGEDCRRGTV